MGVYVASQLIKAMVKKSIQIEGAKILIMGLAFKENCPDLRNTKVVDILHELENFNVQIDVYDPWVDKLKAEHEYGITPIESPTPHAYDAIIIAVAHEEFKNTSTDSIRLFGKSSNFVIYDLKQILPRDAVDLRL